MRDVKDPEIRRAEIMDAAMLLFMEKGYANTTTQVCYTITLRIKKIFCIVSWNVIQRNY